MTRHSDPHVPLRTCIGCRSRQPQAQLVRCVLDADGVARIDRRGDGRGAYLCGAECFQLAVRRRAFDRAWRTTLRPGRLDQLADELSAGTGVSGARLKTTKG